MLINENEAALFLGITKELLYAFVKTGAKGQKLPINASVNNNFFTKDQLNVWNAFLHEPWSLKSNERPEIPSFIKEYLKVESGGKCVRCGSGHRLDNAHIVPWNESLSHHPHNLIRLCTDCHTKYDDGIISRGEIQNLKQARIERIKAEIISASGFSDQFYTAPNPIEKFVGRKNEISKLATLIAKYRFILIEGVGGIGKTQLLLQFIKEQKLKVLWFNIEQHGTLGDLQHDMAKRVCVSSIGDLCDSFDQQNAIVVLDGFEKLWFNERDKASTFLKNLYDHTNTTKFIVSSQVDFSDQAMNPGILELKEGLKRYESFKVLSGLIPNLNSSDSAVQHLVSFSDGHPLTIVLVAGLIHFMGQTGEVLQSIKETGSKIIANPAYQTKNKSTSLQICLITAYNQLNSKQQWLLKHFSHFPAGCKTDFLRFFTSGEHKKFDSETEVNFTLATLSQFNFIQRQEDILGFDRAFMLNPIRIFISEKAKEESARDAHKIKLEASQTLMIEATVFYDKFMLSDQIQYAIGRYEVELPNYLHAFNGAVHSAYCPDCNKNSAKEEYLIIIAGLATGLYKFLFTRGYFQYGIQINEQGAKARIALKHYEAAISDLTQVAMLHWRLYNFEAAARTLDTIKKYEKRIRKKIAAIRLVEGEMQRLKDPLQAIETFKEGIKICDREIKKGDSISALGNKAGLISEIGRTYERNIGDNKTALEYYKQAYNIQKKMKDYANMYCNSHHIGNCYAGIGDNVNAIAFYREALEGFVQLGQQQYIGNSLSELSKMKIAYPDGDYSFLTQDLLKAGLEDIAIEINASLKSNINPDYHLFGKLHHEQISKLWHIIKIVSLSESSYLLEEWAEKLVKLFDNNSPTMRSPTYPWFFAKIAELSCLVEKTPTAHELREELENICYLYGSEVEHDIYDPYEWLALWMRQKGIDHSASRDKIFAAVENRFDNWEGADVT